MQTDKSGLLASADLCTGCGACKEICPKDAIAFYDDKEGFPTPKIDSELCVQCGLCEKSCPALHPSFANHIHETYAVQSKDREVLRESASGGLFTALCRETFRRGGVVFGCVWDDMGNAVIRCAENEAETIPMRGSKYVWSDTGDSFREVQKYLKQDRTVMYVGLPCQVAGLQHYLRGEYPKLLCVELLCGGAPSPMAFKAYLETIARDMPFDALNFKFRDKEKYGVGVNISYQGRSKRVHQSYVRNPYFFCYHIKAFHRRSCYHCIYRYESRVGDLSIGDFWKVERFHSEFNAKLGVSAILVNSDKGKEWFRAVQTQLDVIPTTAENIAYWNNLTLTDKKVEFQMVPYRTELLKTIKEQGWSAAERKYLYNKKRLMLSVKGFTPPIVIRAIKKMQKMQRGR